MRLLGKHTLPEELRSENLSPENSPVFFVSGRKFSGKKQLIDYIKDELIPKYQNQMGSFSGQRKRKLVEVTDKNDKAFLVELFKYHPDPQRSQNITNIYFGPSQENGGVTNCFHIRKFIEEEAEYFEGFDPNHCEFQFPEPAAQILRSQPSQVLRDESPVKVPEEKNISAEDSPKKDLQDEDLESDAIFQQLLSGFDKLGSTHLYTRVSDDFTPIEFGEGCQANKVEVIGNQGENEQTF